MLRMLATKGCRSYIHNLHTSVFWERKKKKKKTVMHVSGVYVFWL